jgi:hypothetical protein
VKKKEKKNCFVDLINKLFCSKCLLILKRMKMIRNSLINSKKVLGREERFFDVCRIREMLIILNVQVKFGKEKFIVVFFDE